MSGSHTTLTDDQRSRREPPRLAPHLDLLLECERPLTGPSRFRLGTVGRVRVGRGADRGVRLGDDGALELTVADGWMSTRHAELTRGDEGWTIADLGSKNGTWHNGARLAAAPVEDGDLLQLGHTFFCLREALPVVGPDWLHARDLLAAPAGLGTLSPGFAEVVARAAALAPSPVPVLLRGESGTGKEVVARALHSLSGRSGAFVAVNCGAIPGELVEAELFGHTRGAFSGAHQERPGLVRAASGGTLFLDEIGDLPPAPQAALLRVLQESEVLPVGASKPVPVRLRVIAATHRDLDALVARGGFRHDLLARLDGVTLQLPPLRERREDLPLLIATLLAKLAPERPTVALAPDAALALLDHGWPLNVRELEQALAGALALSSSGPIEREHLPRALRDGPAAPPPTRELSPEEQQHREEVLALLALHHGNLSAVARVVGKGRTQVVRWIERYGIDADRFRRS